MGNEWAVVFRAKKASLEDVEEFMRLWKKLKVEIKDGNK